MKKAIIFVFIISMLSPLFSYSQEQSQIKDEGPVNEEQNKQTIVKPHAQPPSQYDQMMGPGMMGIGGYSLMVEPRSMAKMLGYVMKPSMIKRFEDDPEAYQQFLNRTQKMRRELLMKMFDYYEALRKPATTPKALKKIEQAIVNLRWKIFDEGSK